MSGYAVAIEALAEHMRVFVRTDTKLLNLVVSTELRKGAIATVMAAEHATDNASPFSLLDHPYTDADAGWAFRSARVRQQHATRRDGADPELPPLPPLEAADDALVGFAEQLWQVAEFRPPGTEGFVVVLAPSRVQSATPWAADLARLVRGRSLAAVRFIVLDAETSTIAPLVANLADAAAMHEVRVDADAAAEAMGRQVAGAQGARPRDVVAPPRRDVPAAAALSPERVRSQAIADKILAAALAMGSGDAVAAVTAQREARDLVADSGDPEGALHMELMLGGHLIAAGQAAPAEESFARALAGARKAGLPSKVAIAGFAVGAVRLVKGERHTALVAYAEAAIAAEKSGEPMLAIEGNRLAGQAAMSLKMEPQAIAFFTRALKLAEATPAAQVSLTTAPDAARGLAAICRKRGLQARAAELEGRAEVLTQPPSLPASPEPPSPPASVEAPVDWAEASIPPPDLLGPPLPPAPTPPPSVPSPADPVLGAAVSLPEASPDFGEGTGILTLQEIADAHWGGQTAPPDASRPWTDEEIEILGDAVRASLDPETTLMLSVDELAALRGESTSTETRPPAARSDPPTAPAPEESFDPDAVIMLPLDAVTRMRKAYEKEQQRDEPEDEEP